MPTITGVHHLTLTVSDVERSVQWYGRLLDMEQVLGGDEETVLWRVLHQANSNLVLALRQYLERAGSGDMFDELRTGLDHLALGVAGRDELMEWQRRAEQLGVAHTPVRETPQGSVLVVRDPDNIQIEFFSNPDT